MGDWTLDFLGVKRPANDVLPFVEMLFVCDDTHLKNRPVERIAALDVLRAGDRVAPMRAIAAGREVAEHERALDGDVHAGPNVVERRGGRVVRCADLRRILSELRSGPIDERAVDRALQLR